MFLVCFYDPVTGEVTWGPISTYEVSPSETIGYNTANYNLWAPNIATGAAGQAPLSGGGNAQGEAGNGGGWNVAIGMGAMADAGPTATAKNCVALGYKALNLTKSDSYNTAVGYMAGGKIGIRQVVGGGEQNTFAGYEAGNMAAGGNNVAIGYKAGSQNLTNIAVASLPTGLQAQQSGNVFLGSYAGKFPIPTTTSNYAEMSPGMSHNVAIGYEAMQCDHVNNAPQSSVAIGFRAAHGLSNINDSANGFIVINATGEALPPQQGGACFIKPIRASCADGSGLWYNNVTGEVTTSAKTFVIPHPEHEGKYLRHACVEAPTRGTNIYEFQIEVTEEPKTTLIELPSYFKYINGRPRVYVSGLDGGEGKVNAAMTHVTVKTERKGTFNVMVTGVRKDAGAVAYSTTEYIDAPISAADLPQSQSVIIGQL